MANVCIFTMQLTGLKENIAEAMNDIFEKDNTKLFPRTDIVMGKEEAMLTVREDGKASSFLLYGQCDWSMNICLFNPAYKGSNVYGYQSLAAFSEKHCLIVEAISVEGSVWEHCLVRCGVVEKNEVFDLEVSVGTNPIPAEFEDYKQEFEKRYEKRQEESRDEKYEKKDISKQKHAKKVCR